MPWTNSTSANSLERSSKACRQRRAARNSGLAIGISAGHVWRFRSTSYRTPTSLPWLCVVSALCWWSFDVFVATGQKVIQLQVWIPQAPRRVFQTVKRAAQVPLPAALRTRLPCAPCAHFLCSRLAGWKAQAFSAKRCRRSNFASHATWSVATKSAGTSGNGEGQKERKKGPGARRGLERGHHAVHSVMMSATKQSKHASAETVESMCALIYWGPSDDAQLWPAVCLKKVGVRPIYGLSMPLLIGEHFDKLPIQW